MQNPQVNRRPRAAPKHDALRLCRAPCGQHPARAREHDTWPCHPAAVRHNALQLLKLRVRRMPMHPLLVPNDGGITVVTIPLGLGREATFFIFSFALGVLALAAFDTRIAHLYV